MKSIRATVVAIVAASFGVCASATECTKLDEYAALAIAGYLDSWNNVFLAYREFRQCDDGAIAEGYSEMVARLLVDHWSRLSELQNLIAKDRDFEPFVLKRVNATLDPKDIEKLKHLVKTNCPRTSRVLCTKLLERAEAAARHRRSCVSHGPFLVVLHGR